MTTHRTISFRIPSEKVDELDALAKSMDRDRSYVLNEAVGGYLDYQQECMKKIERGLEDIRQGRVVDHEVVMQRMNAFIQKARARRRKTA
ncbi:CopG family ribbon-helix-helix protein [Terracidiphilus sp.]|jgi:predicted transcriptional regulator|uniref:CopG family ribbon-helix-helix protein n=1 Tax=Terracidiphilus sp. TaxID=1964191 RepID=UPI003C793955